jgi:hypothetical protein
MFLDGTALAAQGALLHLSSRPVAPLQRHLLHCPEQTIACVRGQYGSADYHSAFRRGICRSFQ